MSRKAIDLTGQQFGRLTIIERAPSRAGKTRWRCKCECGEVRDVLTMHLRSGSSRSCGCFGREQSALDWKKRGMSRARRKHGLSHSREWNAWSNAKRRCYDPTNSRFRYYGARGIGMCQEWRNNFAAFFAHIGPCPPGYSLDRVNNDGNYEPGNVRWATRAQQAQNKRKSRRLQNPSCGEAALEPSLAGAA